MGVYSIKDLENFTQIKAHTLRIWEQRYNLLNPERTETNIRLYSDRDLKKILNINLLYNNGLKISKIAQLTDKEIFEKASELLKEPIENSIDGADRLINKILAYDEFGIRDDLESLYIQHDFEEIFSELLVPVLQKIGELWQVDSITISHEHFFSNIIRSFILKKTEEYHKTNPRKKKVLLFLNEQEYHELGLLYYNYLLNKRGYETIYLGQSVPVEDLRVAVETIHPAYIFTSLTAKMEGKTFSQFFQKLSEFYELNRVYAGGYQMNFYKERVPKNVHVIHNTNDIDLI
jgi:DNA-binding transcriptional MerR regulator/methylmalonyl-CoA mutase cobalamin-binding subunit